MYVLSNQRVFDTEQTICIRIMIYLCGLNITIAMNKSVGQFLKYAAVGVVGLGVEFVSYFILKNYAGLHYVYAHLISVFLAITNNFILNSFFTFKTTDNLLKRAVSFFGFASVGAIGGTFMLPTIKRTLFDLYVNFDITFISLTESNFEDISKLCVTGFVAIVQFFFNKYFTFRKKNTEIVSENNNA